MNLIHGIPKWILTIFDSKKLQIARLQTENGNTAFYDAREFRYFREFNIPTGQSIWIKVVVVENGILIKGQNVTLVEGQVKFRAWRQIESITGVTFVDPVTPAGASDNPAALCSGIFANNNLPSAPEYNRVTSITEGGNHTAVTGGVCAEVKLIKTSGSTAQQVSVGNTSIDERGISPGTYYLEFVSVGTGDAVGEYELKFDERIGEG